MTIWRMSIACWVTGYRRTLSICNTYFFSTLTMVARNAPQCDVISVLPVVLLYVINERPILRIGKKHYVQLLELIS